MEAFIIDNAVCIGMGVEEEVQQLRNQFRMLKERYDTVLEKADTISSDTGNKDIKINILEKEIEDFKETFEQELDLLEDEIERVDEMREDVGKMLGKVVKEGKVERVENRIDTQDYEDLVTRKEFRKLVRRRLE